MGLRHLASKKMALFTENASAQSISPIAMNIGAAHTNDVANYFKSQNRSVVVITPTGLSEFKGDLSRAMYKRKMEKKSVFSEGIVGTILKDFTSGSKKYEPVSNEIWFQARGEMHNYIDKLTHHFYQYGIEGGGPPLSQDEFEGKWISIDLQRLKVVPFGGGGMDYYRIDEKVLDSYRTNGISEEHIEKLKKNTGWKSI